MNHPKHLKFSKSADNLASTVASTNFIVERMVDQAVQVGANEHEVEFGKTCRLMFELDLIVGSQLDEGFEDEG